MEPKVVTQSVVIDKHVEYLEVVKDVVVYRITTTTKVGRHLTTTTSEGVTSLKGIEAFSDGSVALPSYRFGAGSAGVLASPKFRESMRTEGWQADDVYEWIKEATETPYLRFVEGKATAEDFVVVDSSGHMLFDADGVPLPVALHFGYIHSRMDNSRYDLKRALAILKERDDIAFPKGAKILRIPGYNADEDRHEHIDFMWTPKAGDYVRVWEQCKKYTTSHPSTERHRAAIDLDVLGLRAGGAAMYTSFYGEEWVA